MEISKTSLLVVAVVLVTATAGGWYRADKRNRELECQIADIQAQSSIKIKKMNFEFQEKCTHRSEILLHNFGYSMKTTNFRAYYNAALGKCFLSVESSIFDGNKLSEFWFMTDPYEVRMYAEYNWMSDPSPVGTVTRCVLHPPGENNIPCHSSAEYKRFIGKYFD